MSRGLRAEVAWPKLALTICPAGLNCALVLMLDQFTWLNTLYISQRSWIRRLRPMAKFLNVDMFVFTIPGNWKNVRGALPISPRPVRRLKAATSRKLPAPPGCGSQLPLVQTAVPLILGRVPPSPPVKSKLSVVDVLAPAQSPLTSAVSPESCQPSRSPRVNAWFQSRLPLGRSQV